MWGSVKSSYEAALGIKPDLTGIHEWGEKCWVRIEKGNKLGSRVCEGHWVGVDDESKGAQVYWRDTKTITVEWNIYFDPTGVSVDCLEGEDWQFVETTTDEPTSSSSTIPQTAKVPTQPVDEPPAESEPEEEEPQVKCT